MTHFDSVNVLIRNAAAKNEAFDVFNSISRFVTKVIRNGILSAEIKIAGT